MSDPADPARTLRTAVERGAVPGVVAIAGDRAGVIYEGAFGLAETAVKRPMTADAIFDIASMTKAVTSVAALQLIEQGRLALDDPAAQYLPELAAPMVLEAGGELRPAASPITIRHLFTHTSGFGYAFTSERLRQLRRKEGEPEPLLFEPGTQWLYGTSTDWLGRIVAALAGRDLETLFREKIFGPLGMDDTFYNVPAAKHPRIVNFHRRRADGTLAEQTRYAPQAKVRLRGGGGLSSTARDYLRFLRMLLNGGELDGARILTPASVALMGQNHIGAVNLRSLRSADEAVSGNFTFIGDDCDKFGLGFQITTQGLPGLRSAGSLSWGGLFNTYFWLDPARGVAGVILLQYLPFSDPEALALYTDFEREVYRMIK
ncbi:MAG: beta-lactamase family protein [Verrucomicrobia bacterium]|nr:beta-lactamase family protein [Verrucomicrobiota bacterium]